MSPPSILRGVSLLEPLLHSQFVVAQESRLISPLQELKEHEPELDEFLDDYNKVRFETK